MRIKRLLWCSVIGFLLVGCGGQEIAWVTPAEEGEVWGIVRLQVKVTGVTGVHFYVDSVAEEGYIGQGTPGEGALYGMDWYTQNLSNGEHTVYSVAAGSADMANDLSGQVSLEVRVNNRSRNETIPGDVTKMTPQNDPAPPHLEPAFKQIWHDPVPVGDAVNSAGAEDSPFITPDGNTLYFWFTGDPAKDVQTQARDPLTGIYVTHNVNGGWLQPERLYLQYYNQLALDGAQTVCGEVLWFASAREGNYKGVDMWKANLIDGRWTAWSNLGEKLNQEYQVGEMHITADGRELYFDSICPDGLGGKDIWVSRLVDGAWAYPELVSAVSSELDEGWPFVTEDMNELWFTRTHGSPGVFRSLKIAGVWGSPELVLSPLAGEPSLDAAGNLYFAHHRWDEANQRVSEADIYVCYRRD